MECQWRSCLALYICLAVPINKVLPYPVHFLLFFNFKIVNCNTWLITWSTRRVCPAMRIFLCSLIVKQLISEKMNNEIIICITKLLDADWLRSVQLFINYTAVQLLILPKQTKYGKAKWRKAT